MKKCEICEEYKDDVGEVAAPRVGGYDPDALVLVCGDCLERIDRMEDEIRRKK